jgi:hypothetical protein
MIQNNPHYSVLKNNEGKLLRLTFSDGEAVTAKISYVDDEYEDFTYDLLSSTVFREHYRDKEHKSYVGKFSELISAELEN